MLSWLTGNKAAAGAKATADKGDLQLNAKPRLVYSGDRAAHASAAQITQEEAAQIALVRQRLDDYKHKNDPWLDDACIRRYVRAESGDLDSAASRLKATVEWRMDFKPVDGISREDLEAEGAMGRVYLNGFDLNGHPIMYMICRRNGSGDHMRGLRWSIFMLEKAIAAMPPGVEKLSIVVDYSDLNPLKNSTPMHITRMWIDTMQNHYPERLATSFMMNPGWTLWVFFKVIGNFLDPVTKAKINFCKTNPKNPHELPDKTSSSEDNDLHKTSSKDNDLHKTSSEDNDLDKEELIVEESVSKKTAGWGDFVNVHEFIHKDELEHSFGGHFPF
ncbi:MAG: hypothetical protein SGCHY_005265, partial [Lobulomycetales sp.]